MSRDAHFVRFHSDLQWWSAIGPLRTLTVGSFCRESAGIAVRHTSRKRQPRWSQ
jgi:hypothetical protein